MDPVALFSTGSGGEQRGAEVVGGIPVQREANNIVPMPFFKGMQPDKPHGGEDEPPPPHDAPIVNNPKIVRQVTPHRGENRERYRLLTTAWEY